MYAYMVGAKKSLRSVAVITIVVRLFLRYTLRILQLYYEEITHVVR